MIPQIKEHPTNCSTDGICFELAIDSACYLVDLRNIYLNGSMVLSTNYSVAGRAFPRHVEIHELAGVVLHRVRVGPGTER